MKKSLPPISVEPKSKPNPPPNNAGSNEIAFTWTVQETCTERCDSAILRALSEQPSSFDTPPTRAAIQRAIKEGHLLLNQKPFKSAQKLFLGDVIEWRVVRPKPITLVPMDLPLKILFEDEHLAVIVKPAGISTHPSPTDSHYTLVHLLLHHLKDLSGIGGALRPGIVHRLDRQTSGVMVVTKSDAAHAKLSADFAEHRIERKYIALVYGAVYESKTISTLILRNPDDRKKMITAPLNSKKKGKTAITHIRPLVRYSQKSKAPFATLVEATLETGRTHQVRVHLTSMGHSILGDATYGTPSKTQAKSQALPKELQPRAAELKGQLLHAKLLSFKHPISGETLRFEHDILDDFNDFMKACDAYKSTS